MIPRPCIDMTDEGYNVEWSQELRLEESAHEYVAAWALVHLLPRILGWDHTVPEAQLPGAIFDLSVGYNLEGIRHPRMTRFMDVLTDASEDIARIEDAIARDFPHFADIPIPRRIANSVTLSTMHGCPPDEIERIARYLLEERGLHTVVKLNPTLLGKERVLEILHGRLGFTAVDIPDSVFDHDLTYERALALIASLKSVAARRGLTFGVKLSNTLAMRNQLGRLPGDEMYMSGTGTLPGDDGPLRPAGASVRRRHPRVLLRRRRRGERRSGPLVRCGASHGVHRSAQAWRLRPHDAVAAEPRLGDDRGRRREPRRLVAQIASRTCAPRLLTRSSIPATTSARSRTGCRRCRRALASGTAWSRPASRRAPSSRTCRSMPG